MAEILFVTWDGGGNVPPAVGIAEELAARGHRVRFMGHARQAPSFASAGSTSPASPPRVPSTRPCRRRRSPGPGDLRRPRDGRRRRRRAGARARPTSWWSTACSSACWTRCTAAGRSYVALEHSFDTCWRGLAKGPIGLMLRLRGIKALAPPRRRRADDGVPPSRAWTPGTATSCTPEPVVSGSPASPSRPTVLVSLSTFAFKGLQPTWQRVLDAVAPLDARVIATTGPGGRRRPAAGARQRRAARLAPPRRGDARGVDGGRARRSRHDHGGAGPRPAAAGHPDGPDDRPGLHRQGDRAGGSRADDGPEVLAREDPRGRRGAARRRPAPRRRRPPRRGGAQPARCEARARTLSRRVLRNGAAAPGRPSARP